MAEALQRRSPLHEVYQPGRYGSVRVEQPGVWLAQRRALGIVHLSAGRDERRFRTRVEERAGVALPVEPNTASGDDVRAALWQAPGRWLVVAAEPDGVLVRELATVRDELGGAAVDVSHGWVGLRIGGDAARELLAKGCSLDLHAGRFPPGRCAQSECRGVYVFVHAVDGSPRFDLYCQRSFARSLWGWLCDGAAEFGYDVKEWGRTTVSD